MATAISEPRAARRSIDRRWLMPLAILASLAVAYGLMVIGAGAQAQEQFINALTIGAIYALIALGYTMVYGIIELINFAHGEIFMVGSFVCWWLLTTLGITGAITDPVVLVVVLALAFGVSMIVMGIVGVVIERLAYRPLRNAPRLAPLITAIGVSFILQNLVFVMISNSIVTVPQIIPNPVITIGPIEIRQINLFVIVLSLVAHGRAPPVHPANQDGTRDALHGHRPRRGADHGREHQLDDRADLLHRVRARGGGRRRAGPLLRRHLCSSSASRPASRRSRRPCSAASATPPELPSAAS